MWISRQRYEELIAQEAVARYYETTCKELKEKLTEAHDRAERAIEAMLAHRELPSMLPVPPPAEIPDLWAEDPKTLSEMLGKYKNDPMAMLAAEGFGDDGPRE